MTFLEQIIKVWKTKNLGQENIWLWILKIELCHYAIAMLIGKRLLMHIIKNDYVIIIDFEMGTHQAFIEVFRFENKDIIIIDWLV